LESKQVIEEVEGVLMVCKSNKSKLEQAYLFLEQMIKKQFRELEQLLKAKEQEVNDFLEKTF
jgi:HPt (histidine-containing phosphotransfer) domain-containing protein